MGQIDFDGSNSTVKADIIRGQTGTTVKLGGVLDTDGNYIQTEKGGDLTSASPLVIDTDGDYFDVTGTVSFAAMTVAADRQFTLQFDGALTMTHHATNLDLPGEANITTAAGDVATFQSTGSNTVQCINYTRADGSGIAGGGNKNMFVRVVSIDAGGISGSANNNFTELNYDDNVTDNGAGQFTIPSDFTSITSLKVYWHSNATSGNGYFAFNSSSVAADEDVDDGGSTDSLAVTTYATNGTTNGLNIDDITAAVNGLTVTAGDIIGVGVQRQGGDANDTLSASVYVLGMELIYA